MLTNNSTLSLQPADQAVGQPGDPAGDGGQQLPRDGGADAVVRAAVGAAGLAAGRRATEAAAAPPEPPHLTRTAAVMGPGTRSDWPSRQVNINFDLSIETVKVKVDQTPVPE